MPLRIQEIYGTMGSGKTLFATICAVMYAKENPDSKIYANYKIKNLDNFIYNPFLYIPFSELNNAILIIDDIYALKNLKGLTQVIVNISRKKQIYVLMTAQYYTMIPKQIRTVSNVEFRPLYDKVNDILYIRGITKQGEILDYRFNNAVSKTKDYFDTSEIVMFPDKRDIALEIIKFSNNIDDLRKNINLYSQAISRRKKMKKVLLNLNKNDLQEKKGIKNIEKKLKMVKKLE